MKMPHVTALGHVPPTGPPVATALEVYWGWWWAPQEGARAGSAALAADESVGHRRATVSGSRNSEGARAPSEFPPETVECLPPLARAVQNMHMLRGPGRARSYCHSLPPLWRSLDVRARHGISLVPRENTR